MERKVLLSLLSVVFAMILTACGTNNANDSNSNQTNNEVNELADTSNTDEFSTTISRELPDGIKEAENPTFKVGDTVTINAEHEEGMLGAEGIILGAYDTIVYSVSYNPTNDGQPEENHKWVVHEELKGLDEEMLVPGAEVIIEADDEEGMFGAEGEIDTAEKTTVYMVEYILSTGVQKQKWFKESELKAE